MEIAVPLRGTAISRNERFNYVLFYVWLNKQRGLCLAWEAVQQGSVNRGRWDLGVSEHRLGTDPCYTDPCCTALACGMWHGSWM